LSQRSDGGDAVMTPYVRERVRAAKVVV
jgi:hypothetical protein